jgi:ABC-2 type transport system ATP-binding protein
LELYQGEILGLVGENGNGKTTLLRLLCGELYASSGSLKYNFEFSDPYDLRTQLVYIPQRTETWYGSMLENLQFTASSYGYKPDENELIVELTIARLGLRKYRNHTWKSLSSGYKMRFELARMLLRKPKILLIDEPLANLDILAQQTILEDFKAIAKSPFRPIGIVLSSQQLYEVEKASDQVIFLKNGVQKNLHNTTISENEETEKPINNLVIEFESDWSQKQLGELFAKHNMVSLQFNGGTFIVTFPETVSVANFMQLAIDNKISLLYFRNISNSTRRFFVS